MNDLGSVEAGRLLQFAVVAKTCGGNDQSVGGDVVRVEAHKVGKNVLDTPIKQLVHVMITKMERMLAI